MSQNIEENRKQWPKDVDDYTVSKKTIDSKKQWEPPSDYDAGGKYHKVHAKTYRSGQSIEIDETLDGERIRLINTDGSYVEMQHDGSFIHRAQGSSFEVVVKDKNVRVKGAINIHVSGDANMKVDGSMTAEIGGTLEATVAGISKLNLNGGTELNTPFLKIVGDEVSHNGINIGSTHKHKDVEPGGGLSGVPLPI